MATLISGRQAASGQSLRIVSGRQAKASHGRLRSGRQAKSGQSLRVSSGRQARSRQATQEFVDAYLEPTEAGVKTAIRRRPVVTCKYWQSGASTTMPILSYEIQRRIGSPTTWNVTLSNYKRDYREGGPWDGLLDGNPYNQDWAVQRYFTLSMAVANMPAYVFPYLLQLDFEIQQKRRSSVLALSGTDYTDLLLQPDQGMDDVVLGEGSPPFRDNTSVLGEILTEFNVQKFDLNIDSWVVQKMHREGVPMDWIRELLWVTQSDWRWEHDRFIAYQSALAGARWKFDSNLQLTNVNYRKSARLIKNKFTLTRLDKVDGLLLDLDTTEQDGVNPGWQGPFDFAFPSCNFRTKEVKVLGGRLYNWIFLDDDENTVGFSLTDNGFVRTGPPAATKIKFIYEPTIEYMLSGRPYGYKVQLDGTRWVDHPEIGLFDTSYTATKSDATSQAQHGKRPEPPLENTLIPTLAVAQNCVDRMLEEGVRRGCVSTWTTPLPNPYIYPGQTVSITDYKLGLTNARFFVEAVSFKGSRGKHLMTLECTRPLTS